MAFYNLWRNLVLLINNYVYVTMLMTTRNQIGVLIALYAGLLLLLPPWDGSSSFSISSLMQLGHYLYTSSSSKPMAEALKSSKPYSRQQIQSRRV